MTDSFLGDELAREPRFSVEQSRKIFSLALEAAAPAAAVTFHQALVLPAAFNAARGIFLSVGPQISGVKLAFSASSTFGVGYMPTDGAWVSATFAGASTGTIPAGSQTGSNPVWGVLASDWAQVQSNAAANVLMARSYAAGNMPCIAIGSGSQAAYNTIAGGQILGLWTKVGMDGIADPGAFNSPAPNASERMAPAIIQYRTHQRAITVMVIGASNIGGFGSTANVNSYAWQAARTLTAAGVPVSVVNEGYPGSDTANWLTRFSRLVDVILPDVVLINTWTSNNARTRAGAEAGIFAAFEIASACIRRGIVPILSTTGPVGDNDATQDAHRIWANNTVKAATGFLVVDVDAVLSNGATPGRLRPEYDSGDGTHANDAGFAAVAAQQLTPILNRIGGLRATG